MLNEWCLSVRYGALQCDGDQVTLADEVIAEEERVHCSVGDIEVRDLTVKGRLTIDRQGSARLLPGVRSVPPGELSIR